MQLLAATGSRSLVRSSSFGLFFAVCVVFSVASARAQSPAFTATIRPLAAILDELTSPRARVVCLLPTGASPHTWSPRPSDMTRLQNATLFWVAPQLDGWAARLPAKRSVEVLPLVPKQYRLAWDGFADADEAGSDFDPHFWTDPLAIEALLPALTAKLVELDPAGKPVYEANARRMGERMKKLDRELSEILAPVRGRPVVLFHPSFRYLLNRYGLPLAAVIEPAPGKEPGPRGIMNLVERVHSTGARALFTEPQLPRRVAEAVAESAKVPLYELNPLEAGPAGSIEDLLRSNALILRKGLQ